jgi:two-component system response regulator PilR (NtrC family)
MNAEFEDSPAMWRPSNKNGSTYPSPAWRTMMAWVRRIAPTSLPVVIQGESGSGKEKVARALHDLGPRGDGPFVAVNCTAVAESLLEAELFGAMRGAYTGSDRDRPGLFRRADGGTLLLDEVGDMPQAMQAKLLRALESSQVRPVGGTEETTIDVRVLAATHRDLSKLVDAGTFREDLLYRLAVLRVDVPPLRSRPEDLPTLVDELTARLRHQTGQPAPRLSADAWGALRAQRWPGNVRQLHAVLARALLCSSDGLIRDSDLGLPIGRMPLAEPLERGMIEAALSETGGCVTSAASRIGWSKQKLYRRMDVLGLRRLAQGRGGTTSSDSSTFQ